MLPPTNNRHEFAGPIAPLLDEVVDQWVDAAILAHHPPERSSGDSKFKTTIGRTFRAPNLSGRSTSRLDAYFWNAKSPHEAGFCVLFLWEGLV
ncbi:hypothetical protein, partial [Rhizobium leguminosarum]|uniref:hypothetical protein n=1 Tax=Rhizobium leguminosarum TaxID=384 RepID=UPI003F99D0FD